MSGKPPRNYDRSLLLWDTLNLCGVALAILLLVLIVKGPWIMAWLWSVWDKVAR